MDCLAFIQGRFPYYLQLKHTQSEFMLKMPVLPSLNSHIYISKAVTAIKCPPGTRKTYIKKKKLIQGAFHNLLSGKYIYQLCFNYKKT